LLDSLLQEFQILNVGFSLQPFKQKSFLRIQHNIILSKGLEMILIIVHSK